VTNTTSLTKRSSKPYAFMCIWRLVSAVTRAGHFSAIYLMAEQPLNREFGSPTKRPLLTAHPLKRDWL